MTDPALPARAPSSDPKPCAEELARELTRINESLRRREALLAASTQASRHLLEAPDVLQAIPEVLRLIGEAARVDRINLLLTRTGSNEEPLLAVVSEWTAEGVAPHLDAPSVCVYDERRFSAVSAALRAGRSVCLNPDASGCVAAAGIEGIDTQTKAIVPIFVAGEFIGVVGFDNTRQRRAIDSAELTALESAAGVIGAALHRERLIDEMRRERERAAQERVAELARANAVLRSNLERLASEPDLLSFLGHVLLEATRQFDADSGAVVVSKDSLGEWRIAAHAKGGRLAKPPYPSAIPLFGSPFSERFAQPQAVYLDVERQESEYWPGMLSFDRREGYVGVLAYPLVFGSLNVGFLILRFRRKADEVRHSELLVALAQQATLAVQLTRLAHQANEAAVLLERARIGREIHDGLAQAFVGILMQLGAVEESPFCKEKDSAFALTLTRVRDLAREGLAEARRSVMALRLDQTRRAGLELALRQLAERSTVPGRVTCAFEGGAIATGLRPEHEHELLRIAQEAVSNAARHARPSAIRISMTDDAEHWVMAIEDDGRGMVQRPEHYTRDGFGLSNMRQRASAIGGE
ncbi:MAG: histidine kinase, partial [Steroidobacteraceae bacterium]